MFEAESDFDTVSNNSSEGCGCTKKDSNCSDFSWENSDSSEVGMLYRGRHEQRDKPSEKVNSSTEGVSHVSEAASNHVKLVAAEWEALEQNHYTDRPLETSS